MNIPNLQSIVSMELPMLRRPVPDEWRETVSPLGMHSRCFQSGDLAVIASTDTMENGSRWLHVSVSRKDRLPSWDDLRIVKDHFIARNHEAISVLPKDEDYVNLHRYCLHLWSPQP